MPETAPDCNTNQTVIRRVRLDLPAVVPPPFDAMLKRRPYEDWLKDHIQEVMDLENDRGAKLVLGIHSRVGVAPGGAEVFITDFHFSSPENLEYYNAHFLAEMRRRIEDNYPGATGPGSPFTYSIMTLAKDASPADRTKYEEMENGVILFNDIARLGTALQR
jgi:hypothetical protein